MGRSPDADEAAAIAAAVARFEAEAASRPVEEREGIGAWRRAALAEGVAVRGAVRDHLEGGVQWQS